MVGEHESPSETIDVVIAGAGPVGLVLAVELARRGTGVRIIEQLPAPTTESRAIAVHSRSLDHLEALGTLDAVMQRAIVARGMQMHDGEKTIARIAFGTIDAVHPYSVALAQTDTEAVLADRLAELGVVVERSTTLTGYSQDAGGVDLALMVGEGGDAARPARARARYLVGADGAHSMVRRQMGQKLEGSFTGEDFLLGDVEGTHDYDRSQFHTFFSPDTTTGLLFPLPGNRVRVFAQLAAGTDPNRPATLEWLQGALDERGIRLLITESHWLTRLQLKHGQVARYRDRRVFVAGDAAHIHSPAGGLGMNTGIQDAVNLAWKLSAAVRSDATGEDDGADGLLDSYHQERHPVAAAVIAFTTRLSQVGTLSNPIAQKVRNALMHLGLELPGVAERVAGTVEQQNVRYRESSVVGRQVRDRQALGRPVAGARGGAVRPGDYLHLSDTVVASALATTPDHLAIMLPESNATGLSGSASASGTTTASVLPDGFEELTISESDAQRLRRSTGLGAGGGVVIVRPDGYIGFISDDVDSGFAAYRVAAGLIA